jgi:branched-chain amino acid aminotransferase
MGQFGTEFCDQIAIVRYENDAWQQPVIEALKPLAMHPAAHVFHYSSTCFEGFKAYRWNDGKARIFRLQDHVARMRKSAESLRLPIPDGDMLAGMVTGLVAHHLNEIPAPPSSLYLRPTLIGTL